MHAMVHEAESELIRKMYGPRMFHSLVCPEPMTHLTFADSLNLSWYSTNRSMLRFVSRLEETLKLTISSRKNPFLHPQT
jgi:hypothetical protein